MLYVGKDINTTYTWGWAEDGYACDLQKSLTLGKNINSASVSKSVGLNIDLPSLVQRGWILGHEIGHILSGPHVHGDPLMDGWFQYIPALPSYVAGCDVAKTLLESCTIDAKNKKFIDFYDCSNPIP